MDEAHHLKNPETSLARQLQSPESDEDLRTGDGAMAKAFDRMLFLTATPFQLGHQELVRVLERFGDVKWDKSMPKDIDSFRGELRELNRSLTESQRTAILLQKCWARLRPEELPVDGAADQWWESLRSAPADQLTPRQRALLDTYENARKWRADAEGKLRPWIIRHNKGEFWAGTEIARRERLDGAMMQDHSSECAGLEVPPTQLLPFFLAARSAAAPGKDLLGEALCSSYEAFRNTRQHRRVERDEHEQDDHNIDLTHSSWYLSEFDKALEQCSGRAHPKIAATVQKAVDLWENGEKVLVFAFYRHTCRALRIHISEEIERRIMTLARRRFAGAGRSLSDVEIEGALDSIQRRYIDDPKSPARRALDRALHAIVERRKDALDRALIGQDQRDQFVDIMRRFLRVTTTLVRCFPIHEHDTLEPHLAVRSMLDKEDGSGLSWRAKFEAFIDFLVDRCSTAQRETYLEAATRTQTGAIRVAIGEHGDDSEAENGSAEATMTLANVQVATGQTKREQRSRLMRAFNTPFFPDIFVCSEVMGEGVDLQRSCRYVIHHDLAWNPSQIEQRTGRIDRLGCKAENKHPIHVCLPYLAGASDERQYRVMTDREQWFRIVMGQDEVAKLIPDDADHERPPLPSTFSEGLSFDLGLR
jgi:ERCC4-related helicase